MIEPEEEEELWDVYIESISSIDSSKKWCMWGHFYETLPPHLMNQLCMLMQLSLVVIFGIAKVTCVLYDISFDLMMDFFYWHSGKECSLYNIYYYSHSFSCFDQLLLFYFMMDDIWQECRLGSFAKFVEIHLTIKTC
jgi:hypothetical protein